jgi:hypothetical protein
MKLNLKSCVLCDGIFNLNDPDVEILSEGCQRTTIRFRSDKQLVHIVAHQPKRTKKRKGLEAQEEQCQK